MNVTINLNGVDLISSINDWSSMLNIYVQYFPLYGKDIDFEASKSMCPCTKLKALNPDDSHLNCIEWQSTSITKEKEDVLNANLAMSILSAKRAWLQSQWQWKDDRLSMLKILLSWPWLPRMGVAVKPDFSVNQWHKYPTKSNQDQQK